MSSRANNKVYMDIQIGAKGAGRIIFQLFNDLTPKTVQNFRGLCTGQYGKASNVKLHYLNTKFHRIIDGFVVQGGDITHGGGNGGYSIYGRTFVDQNFARTHSCAGLLSMANCGRNTNSSQFFITLKPCPHLDGKHIVFGQVIDGMQVVKKMSKVAIDMKDKPKIPIIIIDCGEIGDFRDFLKYDPFKKSVWQEIRQKKRKLVQDRRSMIKLLSEGLDAQQAYEYKKRIQNCQKEIIGIEKAQQKIKNQKEDQKNEDVPQKIEQPLYKPEISQNLKEKLGQVNTHRLLQLKLKINQAKVLNSKAALAQQIRQNDVNFHKMIKKQEWHQKRKNAQEQLVAKGLNKDKLYLNRNALKKQKLQKVNQSFGWNVFGQQAIYKAYDKRCEGLQMDPQLYRKQMQDSSYQHKPTQQQTNKLVAVVNKAIEKKSQFSRRRVIDDNATVTYINERNRVYNQKLDRAFGKYASASKTSLEMNSQKM